MQNANNQELEGSPFHLGEQTIQERSGKRDSMESFGRQVIRPVMPDQHRQFYEELPFIVVGGVDEEGWPWATLLSGRPGFMKSPDSSSLDFNANIAKGNPLGSVLKKSGSPLGLLGIEMMERRRNRLNGRISETHDSGFSVKVDQSFGNCPQYIQNWDINFIRKPNANLLSKTDTSNTETFTTLDNQARDIISAADTFFVASYIDSKNRPEIEGVDVSHRGGRPGFVKVEGDTLTIPDFPGNFHFNTLGNFLLNPKAGLVFTDFSTGELLMLTGTVELLWEDDEQVAAFKGAERAWRFTLDHGTRLLDILPFRASMKGYSPNSLMTGDWEQTAATLEAEKKRQTWRPFKLTRIEKESTVISSFYLEPADGHGLLPFKAGQFLTIRTIPQGSEQGVIRTYTLSSGPGETYYRISVKREAKGNISKALHDKLCIGDTIEAKAPRGEFFIDDLEKRPAVLLGGGVGITPMISMAAHLVREGFRTRNKRLLTIFHASQTTAERAFSKDFRNLEKTSGGNIRYYSIISKPDEAEKAGFDFDGAGHIDAEMIRQTLPLDDYDFYLCGPATFMQALYDAIRSLGVRDTRIFAEAFGPATLNRKADEGLAQALVIDEAAEAVIKFIKSDFEKPWNAGDGTLLETAESHGLTPDFSCRNGVCGSCATKIKSGSVAYRTKPTAAHGADEALICCAVPAKGSGLVELDL